MSVFRQIKFYIFAERSALDVYKRQEYHHIKKENIGLIEVMGLAVLPARLKQELRQIEFYLEHPEKEVELLENEVLAPHLDWYRTLKARKIPAEKVHEEVRRDVAVIFSEILENAGVYKDTEEGRAAFFRFCAAAGGQISRG